MAVVPTGHPLPSGACRGYRGSAPNPCAAALSPQTSVALFAGNGGRLGVFRQAETAFVRQRQSLVRHFSLADDFIPAAHAFARSKRNGKKEQQTNRRYKHKPAKWLHSSLHFAGRNTVILFEAFGKLRQIGIAYSFGNFVNLVFLLQQ